MAALIDSDYLAAVTGADVTDTDRVEFLLDVASNLVREFTRRPDLEPATAPERAKVATAKLVASALGSDGDDVKAEEVGDYRVEYNRRDVTMEVDIVSDLLGPLRVRNYTLYTVTGFPDSEVEEV